MRYIVAGLGNIGGRRQKVLGDRCVCTVDPYNPQADLRTMDEVAPGSYDAAVLAVPHQVKLELVQRLLELGKHVLVEKPLLFPDDSTAEQFLELARKMGVVWYTSYNHRFEPHIVNIRKLLDDGVVGEFYCARLVYGNGTVRNFIGTWRDDRYGALEEVGCHLIDLAGFLFGYEGSDYVAWDLRAIEARCYDRSIFATQDKRIELECSTLMWKNTFTIDIFGRLGSLHMNGLCKWGPSELIVRTRVFPSGVPLERREVLVQPDRTWEADIEHFERQVQAGQTSYTNDLRISRAIRAIAGGQGPSGVTATDSQKHQSGAIKGKSSL